MTFRSFLAAVHRYRRTFVFVTAIVLGAGLAVLLLTPTQYVSSQQLLVTIDGSTTAQAYENDQVVTARVNSYIPLLTSDVVAQRVVDKLHLGLTTAELSSKISAVRVPPNTALIDVAVSDRSPEQARLIADTLGAEFISYTNALETPTGEDAQKVHTRVVSAAGEPHRRTLDRVLLGILAAAAAVLAGATAVWIRSRSDPLVRTAEEAADAAGAPMLGSVSADAATDTDELLDYRRLRARLAGGPGSGPGSDHGTVLVMASATGEVDPGVVARNLGLASERAGERTVVLDTASGDADAPTIAAEPAGRPDSAATPSSDLFGTAMGLAYLDELRRDYRTVIVVAPPALSALTVAEASRHADVIVLLAAPGLTRRADIRRAVAELRVVGAGPTGVVAVDATVRKQSSDPATARPRRVTSSDHREGN